MAFITLSGTLLDPNGDLAVGDQIRFTHNSTTGQTVQSAASIITVNPSGTYSLPLQYGLVLVEYKDVKNHQFKNLGVATVNATNTATSIPELLNALTPVSSAELIEFQAILADCVAAQTAAENAADISEAFANQLTTAGLIASTAVYATNVVIYTSGFTTSGDGGSGQWKQTGVTGQTVSQTPAQLNNALLNDGLGNQWALAIDATLLFSSLGVLPDSGDVSDQFNAGVFCLKSNGYTGELPSGDIYARNIRLEGGIKYWSLKGQGKRITTLRQTTGEGTLLIGNAGSGVGYELRGFTVDCRYSELNPISANNGISVADTNDVLIADIEVIDYLEDAILIFSTSPGSHRNATIDNCNCDGNTKAGNGFLISSYENGRILNSYAENVRSTEGSGPGYGVQLKNECVGGGIFDSWANNCIAGAAFGFADEILGVSNSQVKNFNSVQCDGAFYGLATNCDIDVNCDMKSLGESAISLDKDSTGNRVQGVVVNLATSKGAIRYRGNAKNNSASITCHNFNLSGAYAIYDSLTDNNSTVVVGHTKTDIPENGYRNVAAFSGTTSNSLIINSFVPVHSQLVIVSNQIVVENKSYAMARLDTSGGNDDLITISSNFADGQVLNVVNVSNSRVVTIKNSGNIITKDGLDLLLDDKIKIYSFMFLSSVSKFVQM